MCISSKEEESRKSPNIYPLLSEVSEMEKHLKENHLKDLQYLKHFLSLFRKHALFIVNNEIRKSRFFEKTKIPVIDLKNLEKISSEEQFRSYFHQTESNKSKLLN
jgi:hypothetical protein